MYLVGIIKNFEINNDYNYNDYKCEHLKNGKLKLVITGQNEGGFNNVGMCGECLLEIIKDNLEI